MSSLYGGRARRCFVLGLLTFLAGGGVAQQHQYRYDGPEVQKAVDELKMQHEYLSLQVGATLTSRGRRLTVTVVHQDGAALLVEGTIKNLTGNMMFADTLSLLLNESPDRQMKWFKAHPVTGEYHYGPGFNSHSEAQAVVSVIKPGETGSFVAVWNTSLDGIAAEAPAELVVTL